MRTGAIRSLAIGLSFATLLAACGGDDGGGSGATGGSPTAQTSGASTVGTVGVVGSDLGSILADADGKTLYLFEADTDGASTCYGDCAATWPALVDEAPTGGDGVDASLLGTTARDDGSMQVTYADHPLYYYAADAAPGDTTGQGVGDVWFVVNPDGSPVTKEAQRRPDY